jgi:Xaa-Pro aminopeptidase
MKSHKRGLRFILGLLMIATLWPIQALWPQASDPYAVRRDAVIDHIGKAIAIIPGQLQSGRGAQDNKDFFYLTGVLEPEALLVLTGEGEKKHTLFNRSGKWTSGNPPSRLDVRPLTDIRMFLMRGAAGKAIHLPFSSLDGLLPGLGGAFVLSSAAELINLDPVLAEMRIVKSPEEIKILQEAIDITTDAYIEVMKAAQPGMRELDLKAIFQFAYVRREATESFLQVASGPNSINIHFGATTRAIQAGDVIVFDLGAWSNRYTSDISRTLPVSGKFTKEQAEIYNVVLSAQKEGIKLMVPGNGIEKVQAAVEDALLQGLQKLGLVTDPASPWQRRLFIQHGFIHGIGLDVHDVWGWFSRQMREGLTFKPGMVLTMEPGLYFPVDRLDKFQAGPRSQVPEEEWKTFTAKIGPLYKKYANIGCRIEDDVLVTEKGNQVLTARAPKEIADIEKLMKLPSPFNQLK